MIDVSAQRYKHTDHLTFLKYQMDLMTLDGDFFFNVFSGKNICGLAVQNKSSGRGFSLCLKF